MHCDGVSRLLFTGSWGEVEGHRPSGSRASGQSASLYPSAKGRPTPIPGAVPSTGQGGGAEARAVTGSRGVVGLRSTPDPEWFPAWANGTSTLCHLV